MGLKFNQIILILSGLLSHIALLAGPNDRPKSMRGALFELSLHTGPIETYKISRAAKDDFKFNPLLRFALGDDTVFRDSLAEATTIQYVLTSSRENNPDIDEGWIIASFDRNLKRLEIISIVAVGVMGEDGLSRVAIREFENILPEGFHLSFRQPPPGHRGKSYHIFNFMYFGAGMNAPIDHLEPVNIEWNRSEQKNLKNNCKLVLKDTPNGWIAFGSSELERELIVRPIGNSDRTHFSSVRLNDLARGVWVRLPGLDEHTIYYYPVGILDVDFPISHSDIEVWDAPPTLVSNALLLKSFSRDTSEGLKTLSLQTISNEPRCAAWLRKIGILFDRKP